MIIMTISFHKIINIVPLVSVSLCLYVICRVHPNLNIVTQIPLELVIVLASHVVGRGLTSQLGHTKYLH